MMLFATTTAAQRYSSIRPGQKWLDTEGKPIHAHGFQIFEKDGTYYWYGENKEHTHLNSNVWTWGIRAYRSKDFYIWEDLGLIIPPDTTDVKSPLHYSQTLDRPLYNKNTKKWVCWIKSMDTDGYFVILQSDNFEEPYNVVKSLKPEGFGVGDFDMYCDPHTGKGYVWFERPHWEMICAELTDDFLGTNGRFSEHFVGLRPPFTREAPSHFVWRGRHYMFTSGTTGYVPNSSKVAVFDDYHGEYTDLGDPCVTAVIGLGILSLREIAHLQPPLTVEIILHALSCLHRRQKGKHDNHDGKSKNLHIHIFSFHHFKAAHDGQQVVCAAHRWVTIIRYPASCRIVAFGQVTSEYAIGRTSGCAR